MGGVCAARAADGGGAARELLLHPGGGREGGGLAEDVGLTPAPAPYLGTHAGANQRNRAGSFSEYKKKSFLEIYCFYFFFLLFFSSLEVTHNV